MAVADGVGGLPMADLSFMKLAVPARGVYGLLQGGNRAQPSNGVRVALPPARMAADTSDPIPAALRKPMQDTAVNPSFRDLAIALSRQNGGKISLNQLNSLADVAYKVSPRQVQRTPTFKDVAINDYRNMVNEAIGAQMAEAKARVDAGDVSAKKDYGAAVDKYLQLLAPLVGGDPYTTPRLGGMPAADDEEY